MSLFSKQEGYVGVDIGAHGIKVVELRQTKSRPQLWTYGMLSQSLDIHTGIHNPLQDRVVDESATAPHTEDIVSLDKKPESAQKKSIVFDEAETKKIQEYGMLLKEVVKQAKVTSKRATASLPVSQVFHAIITLPKTAQKELDHHVDAKVKKMLSVPIEDMQVVHQIIPESKIVPGTAAAALPPSTQSSSFLRVLVTAAPKRIVSFYSAVFAAAGLQLEELETEAFALERSLVGKDTSTVMVIDIGAERTNFFIMDQGLPITHRSVYLGGNMFDTFLAEKLGLDIAAVAQIKKDFSKSGGSSLPLELFRSLTDQITKEVGYSMDMFTRQTGNEGKRLEKIILTGGAALFPPILSAIKEKFPVTVFIGDPWARVVYQQRLKQILDEIGPRMAVSIGLAMRNIV